MFNWRNIVKVGAAASCLLGSAWASAAPTGISYVGELRAENGVLYTGSVSVTASLHSHASDNAMVWGPQDLGSIAVSQGLFTAVLGGSGSALDIALMDHDDLWLQLTIDGAPLSPRQRLRSVPFARVAATAQAVGDTPAAEIATLDDLSNHPIAAFSSMTPPASPVPGQFWLDSSEGKVYVWSEGEWAAVSSAGLEPSELPGDGLNEVSNQTLSNEFLNVTRAWTSGPTNIPDNNPTGINASITLQEGASAKLYGLKIRSTLELNVVSQVQIVLQPPPSTNVNPIILFDDVLAPQPGQVPLEISMEWTPANTPALGALLNKLPAGQWTLNVSDDQLTVVQPPLIIGKLTQFDITYDVLRSDEIAVQGDMYVLGDQVNAGTLQVEGAISSKVIMYSGGCTSHGTASGYNKYCLNGTEYDTTQGYLSINPNGDVTVLRGGVYEVNYQIICGGGGGGENDSEIRRVRNGSDAQVGIARCNAANGGWWNNQIRRTLPLQEGDVIYVRSQKGSMSYAFHLWGPGGWGGLQIRYLGH